ncbi:MAG: hypothetical protein ACE5EO_04710 [Candidatus Krumholzibacteriia bacterium]
MNHSGTPVTILRAFALAVALFALVPLVTPWQHVSGQAAGYLAMTFFPGLALHLLLARERRLSECLLASVVTSPVLVAAACALLMLAGFAPATAARVLILFSTAAAAATAVLAGRGHWLSRPPPAQLWTLAAVLAVFCALAGYLPLTDGWWRYWSDAWFHGGVVHQIDTYGVPPEDPYFVGMDLQYMWIYHVLVLAVSRGAGIPPLVVMPLLNLNALLGFMVSAYLLSTLFRKRFAHGLFAVLFAVLAMNAVVWAFLPLKLAKALLGDVRGWAEVVRTYSVVPFDKETVWTFLRFYNNQPFLLNKFIVSTALSLALCFMGGFWYASLAYMSTGRFYYLVLLVFAALGALGFHTVFGVVMIGGLLGGLLLLVLARGGVRDFSKRRTAALSAAVMLATALAVPYLYSVLHLKESEKLFPVGLSMAKTGGVLVSCALVMVLAARRLRPLLARRTAGAWLFVFVSLSVFVICNVIRLPGINTYDKLPFFVHFPFAVMGSWVFADRFARPHASPRYRTRVVLAALLLLLPVNTFAWLAYHNTPTGDFVSPAAEELSAWVRQNTPRDAIFFENNDRVLLLLTGPRRYYWGRIIYADNWGYPKDEMAHRKHVRDNLYSTAALDAVTLATLGGMGAEVYVVVRDAEDGTRTLTKTARYPALFRQVYRARGAVILRVDRAACTSAAASLPRPAP